MADEITVATNPAEAEALMNPANQNEFEETMRMIEADKAQKLAELEKYQAEKNTKLPVATKPQPLRLEYKFTGQDPEGHEVTTLMLDTEAGYYANAFCLAENKQVLSIKVSKLPNLQKGRFIIDRDSGLAERDIIAVEKKEKKPNAR